MNIDTSNDDVKFSTGVNSTPLSEENKVFEGSPESPLPTASRYDGVDAGRGKTEDKPKDFCLVATPSASSVFCDDIENSA